MKEAAEFLALDRRHEVPADVTVEDVQPVDAEQQGDQGAGEEFGLGAGR